MTIKQDKNASSLWVACGVYPKCAFWMKCNINMDDSYPTLFFTTISSNLHEALLESGHPTAPKAIEADNIRLKVQCGSLQQITCAVPVVAWKPDEITVINISSQTSQPQVKSTLQYSSTAVYYSWLFQQKCPIPRTPPYPSPPQRNGNHMGITCVPRWKSPSSCDNPTFQVMHSAVIAHQAWLQGHW